MISAAVETLRTKKKKETGIGTGQSGTKPKLGLIDRRNDSEWIYYLGGLESNGTRSDKEKPKKHNKGKPNSNITKSKWFRRQLNADLARASDDTQSWGLNGFG